MSNWLAVLGQAEGLKWVVGNRRLPLTLTGCSRYTFQQGDRVFLLVTRGAYHNPTRDRTRLIAAATVTGHSRPLAPPVRILSWEFHCFAPLGSC